MAENVKDNNGAAWYGSGSAEELKSLEHLLIWGDTIPGNSGLDKSVSLELRRPLIHTQLLDLIRYTIALKSQKFSAGAKRSIDNFVWYYVRKDDDSFNDTFVDEPFLIPYIAEGSDKAVIVVPGGGFCSKSMESEGTHIAKTLQDKGITAFVLWYRSNPYYMPYPLMDMQRAVRYVRYHAKDYGYRPDKIGAIGFSAGGAQITLHMNVMHQKLITLPEYPHDDIDAVDDSLNFMAPIYPALSFNYNCNMLYACCSKADAENKAVQQAVKQTYDAIRHFSCQGIPHFISYGTKDTMVSTREIQQYIDLLQKSGTPCTVVPVEGAGHGYGDAAGTPNGFWLDRFTEWAVQLSVRRTPQE